jgi:DNA invertase Pin-like site-specific DNA recombinase
MIEAGTSKPAPFDVVIVHSFSRFFRDHFEMEFHVRKLAKNGVKLLSITQEIGDDPVHQMMRQIMALFDEYQSKENAKHVLRAQKENARQASGMARCRRSVIASSRQRCAAPRSRRSWRSTRSMPRRCG